MLGKESLNGTFAIILAEESRTTVTLDSQTLDGSTMISTKFVDDGVKVNLRIKN